VLPPRPPFHRLDLRVIEAQIETADQLPDQTRAMTFVDQLFDIDAAQHKLLSIDRGKSRFSRHAVVAHIRSLRAMANFAMTLLDRVTISSQLPVPAFPRIPPVPSVHAFRLSRIPPHIVPVLHARSLLRASQRRLRNTVAPARAKTVRVRTQ